MPDPLRDDVPGGKSTPSEGSISATMMIAAVGLVLGLLAIALVMWDPLESTCRHASLSIL